MSAPGCRAKAEARWPDIDSLPPGVRCLPHLDMTYSIGRRARFMEDPLNETKFLKELGYFECQFTGNSEAKVNKTMHSVVKGIQGLCPDFGFFQRMSTKPADVFDKVMGKIDNAPKETHRYFQRMWNTYKAISVYCLERKRCLRKLTDREIVSKLRNKDSGCGPQDRAMRCDTVAEYIKSGKWKNEERRFKESLARRKPIKAVWNTVAKLEPKKAHEPAGVRLICYLCATARIYEARLFGHLDNIVRSLPYSVLGLDLSDYGEALADIMGQDKHAVCDDVKSWDTRVGYTLLCLEAKFLQSLAPGEENASYRKEIALMYSIYANALINIRRPGLVEGAKNHNVLYQLQGQVPSGRRVTYSMNTITNMVITMCRAAISQEVPEQQMFHWALNKLRRGHSDEYGGKICGDDSVIIMSPENAEKYANQAQFMEEIGFPRKNIQPGEPSKVIKQVSGIHFCGNNFVQVDFPYTGPTQHTRWMPVAPAGKIIARAVLMPTKFDDDVSDKSYAKSKAWSLLVRYFHIKTVRLIVEAILSFTPSRFVHNDRTGGSLGKHWLTDEAILNGLNRRLFGDGTRYPSKYRLNHIQELGYLNDELQKKYDINCNSKDYVTWKRDLPGLTKNWASQEELETKSRRMCLLVRYADDSTRPPSAPVVTTIRHRN